MARKRSLGERQLTGDAPRRLRACGNPKPKPPQAPTDYIDALDLHLQGKWPTRRLTELEWAVLAFMGLHTVTYNPEDDVYISGQDQMTSTSYGDNSPLYTMHGWHGLYPNVRDYANSLFHVFPMEDDAPAMHDCFKYARRTMEGLRKLFLVERCPYDVDYWTYRLTPFGHTYLGPINRALSEPGN